MLELAAATVIKPVSYRCLREIPDPHLDSTQPIYPDEITDSARYSKHHLPDKEMHNYNRKRPAETLGHII